MIKRFIGLILFVFIGASIFIFFWDLFGRLRSSGNEESAYINLTGIMKGAYLFYLERGHYPKDLKEMISPILKGGGQGSPYILKSLSDGNDDGYDFDIINTGSETTFLAVAYPATERDVWSFCVVHDFNSGKPTSAISPIRYDERGKLITKAEDCLNLKSVGHTY